MSVQRDGEFGSMRHPEKMLEQMPEKISPAHPRVITLLDSTKPLSQAMCDVLLAGLKRSDDARAADTERAPLDLSRTVVLVPGGRIVRNIERELLERSRCAGSPLFAPSLITPSMLSSRFVIARARSLSALATRLSWRMTLDGALARTDDGAQRVRRLLGVRDGVAENVAPSSALREKLAVRLVKLSRETASAMQTIAAIAATAAGNAHGHSPDAALADRWQTLAQLDAMRRALLARCGADDRDAAFAEAVRDGHLSSELVDRIVVLFADPEPVHRALLAVLEQRGVQIEVCVHTRESIDAEGFPRVDAWSTRAFGTDAIPSSMIRVALTPLDAGAKVIDAIRALPASRTSDEVAIMAPDDDTRHAIERTILSEGVRAVGSDARDFAATHLGTLLARTRDLFAEATAESLAAFVRHPDVMHALGSTAAHLERSLADYREATRVHEWRAEIAPRASQAKGMREVRDAVAAMVKPLEGRRAASEWAEPIRSVMRALLTPSLTPSPASPTQASPTFAREHLNEQLELKHSIASFDRALSDLASVPVELAATMEVHEAIAYLLSELAQVELRGDGSDDGVTVVGWLDAGLADERHLILAGFCDGAVPQRAASDSWWPDALRQAVGASCGARRAARDAWILHGLLTRAAQRSNASISFVVPRRTASNDPTSPSRFLLSVSSEELPARVAHLFPKDSGEDDRSETQSAPSDARFPPTPAVAEEENSEHGHFASISVTAFKTYLQCPYLFQLQHDPRLKLDACDEQAVELDAGAFGTLVHTALERWGAREAARAVATTDADAITRELDADLDAVLLDRFPTSVSSAVKVQFALARRRLKQFAHIQAKHAADGWKVHAVEMTFAVSPRAGQFQAPMFPDADGLALVGKIDRIDVNAAGEYAAWDYKTSSKAVSADSAHVRGIRGNAGKTSKGRKADDWINLQLPLYRFLLMSRGMAISGVGFINLAPSKEKTTFERLTLDAFCLETALQVGGEVVACVTRGAFAPARTMPVAPDSPLARLWRKGMHLDDASEQTAYARDRAYDAGGDE